MAIKATVTTAQGVEVPDCYIRVWPGMALFDKESRAICSVLAFVGEEQADDPEKQIRSWSVTIDNIGKSKKAADLRSLAYDRLKSEAQAAKDNLAAAVKSKREDHIEAATARMARWFDPDSAVDA